MQTCVLHKHTTDTYIYYYTVWIDKSVQMSTRGGVSHKSTKYTELLQYNNIVICIEYPNVIVNPLHTADNRKLE